MKLQQFHYHLPKELIAKYPPKERGESRLLIVGDEGNQHCQFNELYGFLKAGDLLVINNTKVMLARLYGTKSTGGKIEVLIERLLSETVALAQIRSSKSPKVGSKLLLENALEVHVKGRHESLFELKSSMPWLDIMESQGHVPLPPYIDREDELQDKNRYQTVFAKHEGAVAAPTAGLHFEDNFREQLNQQQVNIAEVTLHVGSGTFQPVRAEHIENHKMHAEWIQIDETTCQKINDTKKRGNQVFAVGTTAVRVLETATDSEGIIQPYSGDTNIFITPGYQFKMVDAMITNFHLPESTLLMLVCAFGGYRSIMDAYQQAIGRRYRFFSYGDAMLLSRRNLSKL